MMSPLRSRRVAVLCVVLLLVVTGCTDGLLVPEPEGVDDPEPETSLCGTDGNDPCEMDEVVVEEIWDPPPAFPDPIDEPLPGGPDDPGSIPTIPPDDPDDGPAPVATVVIPIGDDNTVPVDTFRIDVDAPNCAQSHSEQWKRDYCRSSEPQGERLNATEAALDRIESRGGECRTIAAYGRKLLSIGTLRYYPREDSSPGGHGVAGLIMLADDWVTQYANTPTLETLPDGTPIQRNLDQMIVHEIDHAMLDNEHGDIHSNYGFSTPNSSSCSGLNQ